MKDWIYWNRRMWVFCLLLTQVACWEEICGWIEAFPPGDGIGGRIEDNRGQADPSFRYVLPGRGGAALFADQGLTLSLGRRGAPIELKLAGARSARAEAEDPKVTLVNYFIGNDPAKWVRDVHTFGRIRYRSVYPGIDMVFHGMSKETGSFEQDFEVAPGAQPSNIRMRFEGADRVAREHDGSLTIHVQGRELRWQNPVVYQHVPGGKRMVRSAYRVYENSEIGFEIGSYLTGRPLVIDPVISFSTYVGGAGNDAPGRTVTDPQGNIYTVGATNDPNFPVSPGAYTINNSGGLGLVGSGATITKLDSTGAQALFVTHFGGTIQNYAAGVALDSSNNMYLAGYTFGSDFPTTANAFQKSAAATDSACFVIKLNAAGNQLLYSTYLNGSAFDACTAIAVDASGSAYVAGGTNSRDFPVTGGVLQNSFRPSSSAVAHDGFVAKLSPDGSRLLYSTFFGGSGSDLILALALDSQNDVFVSGYTTSPDLPVTPGAFSTTYGGGGAADQTIVSGDAFVAKINPTGSALIYSAYLGGRLDDIGTAIAVDTAGNAYVAGSTMSSNFPITAGAYQTKYAGAGGEANFPSGDAFVSKVNPAGTALIYSTYLGGTRDDRAWAIAVDGSGAAWVGGYTLSRDFPVSADAHQKKYGGERAGEAVTFGDGFITRMNAAGSGLTYSSYHGGSGNDIVIGLALTAGNGVIVTGSTSSRDLLVTAGSYQTVPRGGDLGNAPWLDLFVFKLADPPPPPTVTISSIANEASGITGPVSPGLVVSISGSNFAAANAAADLTLASLPFALGQTRVLFDGAAAPLISVSPQKIVAIAPYRLQSGAMTQVVVDWNGNRSAGTLLAVMDSAPGLYSSRIQNGDGSANSPDNPATPSGTVTIAGTGEGQTIPAGVDGLIVTADAVPLPVLPVSATLGGNDVGVAGINSITGEPTGRFQIQITLPDQIDPGDYQVVVQIGTAQSQSVVVSVGAAPSSGTARRKGRKP